MTNLQQSNIYSASAEEIGGLFGDYLDGSAACPVLVLSEQPLGNVARNALAKTFSSFGYGSSGTCGYATLHPVNATEEWDIALDSQALFLLVEGLDPVCMVCADEASATCLGKAYRTTFELDSPARVFGRPAVAFRDFTAMLATDEGKQRAWHILKSFPKR